MNACAENFLFDSAVTYLGDVPYSVELQLITFASLINLEFSFGLWYCVLHNLVERVCASCGCTSERT